MCAQMLRFLTDEDGVVTIEWVALAAGVAILAFGVIVALEASLFSTAQSIGAGVQDATNSIVAQY